MQETFTNKKHIAILGGGTAGWITANLLLKKLPKTHFSISLIESTEIGIIGVGEGSTPQLKKFFDDIEVSESEWMPKCNATYKNGIRFKQWSTKPGFEQYFHPFASKIDAFSAPIFIYNATMRRRGFDIHAHPDRYYVAQALAQERLAPKEPEHFPFPIGYGYHFDAVLMAQFLSELAVKRGVEHIQGKVAEVTQHANQHISALRLESDQLIEADFYIDCSGFASILIEKTLNTPFVSFASNLFNDSAVAIPTQLTDGPESETTSTAMKNGWAWKIPLTNRTGNGYVYSSKYSDKDQAEQELRAHIGALESDTEARHLKMRVGRFEKHWHKNVLAVGLSQGFIEPLEATALHFVIETVEQFIGAYTEGHYSNQHQREYNQVINRRFEGVRDYIVTHFKLTSRKDTQYWLDNAANTELSDSLTSLLKCWQSGQDLTQEVNRQRIGEYYPPFSWYCIFAGYGVYPNAQQLQSGNKQTHKYNLSDIDDFIRRSALNFPLHAEALEFK